MNTDASDLILRRERLRWHYPQNSMERLLGVHCIVCRMCDRPNAWKLQDARPACCHACGARLRSPDDGRCR